jgi:hypothetical protein
VRHEFHPEAAKGLVHFSPSALLALQRDFAYDFGMSTATTTLLAAFEVLPDSEKQQFVNAVCRRLPPVDSGPLDDELVAQAGDDLAALMALEEHETSAR